eukprot:scaffold10.g2429.t1
MTEIAPGEGRTMRRTLLVSLLLLASAVARAKKGGAAERYLKHLDLIDEEGASRGPRCRRRVACTLRLLRLLVNTLMEMDDSVTLDRLEWRWLHVLLAGELLLARAAAGRSPIVPEMAMEVGAALGFDWGPCWQRAYEELDARFGEGWQRAEPGRCWDDWAALSRMARGGGGGAALARRIVDVGECRWSERAQRAGARGGVGKAWGRAREAVFGGIRDYFTPWGVQGNVAIDTELTWTLPVAAFDWWLEDCEDSEGYAFAYSPSFSAFGKAWSLVMYALGHEAYFGIAHAYGGAPPKPAPHDPGYPPVALRVWVLGPSGPHGPVSVQESSPKQCTFNRVRPEACFARPAFSLHNALVAPGSAEAAAVVDGELLLEFELEELEPGPGRHPPPRLVASPLLRWSYPYTRRAPGPQSLAGFRSLRLPGSGYDGTRANLSSTWQPDAGLLRAAAARLAEATEAALGAGAPPAPPGGADPEPHIDPLPPHERAALELIRQEERAKEAAAAAAARREEKRRRQREAKAQAEARARRAAEEAARAAAAKAAAACTAEEAAVRAAAEAAEAAAREERESERREAVQAKLRKAEDIAALVASIEPQFAEQQATATAAARVQQQEWTRARQQAG